MATTASRSIIEDHWHPVPRYDRWVEAQHVPVHHEFFIEDLRTLPVGPWEERECNAAVVVLAGQEGVTEARVTEVAPGTETAPLKFGLDEFVYVLEGRGLTSIWAEGRPKLTFEWQKHSLFVLPRSYMHRFSSVQGNQPARLLHFNYLPVAMSVIPEPDYFFNNPHVEPDRDIYDPEDWQLYSSLTFVDHGERGRGAFWVGNFFPDAKAWDKMHRMENRGAGGSSATFVFPGTAMRAGLPTMPVGVYKKAHRHGPGIVIVIPSGEGMSVMWPQGGEKMFCVWHEGSVFVPPNQWWHQHFNLGPVPARYITLHPPRHPLFGSAFGAKPTVQWPGMPEQDRQIEYPDEDPEVRRRFEAELAKRGLKSLMPPECYLDYEYKWTYPDDGE